MRRKPPGQDFTFFSTVDGLLDGEVDGEADGEM